MFPAHKVGNVTCGESKQSPPTLLSDFLSHRSAGLFPEAVFFPASRSPEPSSRGEAPFSQLMVAAPNHRAISHVAAHQVKVSPGEGIHMIVQDRWRGKGPIAPVTGRSAIPAEGGCRVLPSSESRGRVPSVEGLASSPRVAQSRLGLRHANERRSACRRGRQTNDSWRGLGGRIGHPSPADRVSPDRSAHAPH